MFLDQPFCDGTAHEAARDQAESGESNSGQACAWQSGGLGLLSPSNGSPVATGQRYTAREQAVAGMDSECLGKQDSGDVLNQQEDRCTNDQDSQCLAACFEPRKLGRDANGRKKHHQQRVANRHLKHDLWTADSADDRDDNAAQQSSRHSDRNAELAKRRNLLRDRVAHREHEDCPDHNVGTANNDLIHYAISHLRSLLKQKHNLARYTQSRVVPYRNRPPESCKWWIAPTIDLIADSVPLVMTLRIP